MKKCSFSERCPFFNDQLPKKRSSREREELKKKFCGGGNTQCARFMVAAVLGLEAVPGNLFPDHLYRVSTILEMP
jgi:hypothetical protein